MSFQFPWALLLLIAVPVLIIIYIIRNRYKDVTAPSTYLWEQAAKLLKKRNPLRKFENLLALILEIATIVFFSFAVAHPVINLEGQADDIVFVVDGSASMQLKEEDGETRFQKAIASVEEKAKDATKGSSFTLILANGETRTVCSKVRDLDRFEMYLDTLEPSEGAGDLKEALTTAQSLVSTGEANTVYLASDHVYPKDGNENVEFLDCGLAQVNYAVHSLAYKIKDGILSLSGTCAVYGKDDTINVKLSLNGKEIGTLPVQCTDGIETPFAINNVKKQADWVDINDIDSLEAHAENGDALPEDDAYILYANDTEVNVKTLLVSDKPLYFEAGFKALSNLGVNVNLTVISTAKYSSNVANYDHGYDVTVFHGLTPSALPSNGAIWFAKQTNTVEGSGFRYQDTYQISDGAIMDYSENSTLLYQELTKGLAKSDVHFNEYMRCSLLNDFTSILSYQNVPLVFAGKADSGQREVVFSFDFEKADLTLKYDWLMLLRNFMNYSKPQILTKFAYTVNDSLAITLPEDFTRATVKLPDGSESPLVSLDDTVLSYTLGEVGSYTLTVDASSGSKTFNVYSAFPKEESNPAYQEPEALAIATSSMTEKGDGVFDNILPLIIVAAVVFGADWIIYAHEQY